MDFRYFRVTRRVAFFRRIACFRDDFLHVLRWGRFALGQEGGVLSLSYQYNDNDEYDEGFNVTVDCNRAMDLSICLCDRYL